MCASVDRAGASLRSGEVQRHDIIWPPSHDLWLVLSWTVDVAIGFIW
jgi:hypothetical protein